MRHCSTETVRLVACLAARSRPASSLARSHLQDVDEVLLVDAQEVTAVLAQDDGGGSGGIIHQGQLTEIITLVQRGHQTLRTNTHAHT